MKKLVFTIVAIIATICASAQTFYAISGVEQHERSFYISCATGRVPVNVLIFRAVQAEPSRYVVVTIEGDNFQTVTVCDREDIFTEVHEVDSVGMDKEGNPLVFFTDGETFCEEDTTWFRLNKGQKLEKFSLLGLTKNFWQWRTVSRSTEAHAKQVATIEVVPAPKAAEKPVAKPTPSATVPTAKSTISANYSGMSKAEAKAAEKAVEAKLKADAKAAKAAEKAAKAEAKARAKARAKAAEEAAKAEAKAAEEAAEAEAKAAEKAAKEAEAKAKAKAKAAAGSAKGLIRMTL